MFSITVAAAATMIALMQPPVIRPTTVALMTATDLVTVSDHLDSARRALASGAFDVARREFVVAVALDRDAGRVPTEASFGLAHTLYAQSYNVEAAIVLNRLAQDAARAGDADTEAKALLDAVWLHVDAGQRNQARADAHRLRALLSDNRVSAETRKAITRRIG